MLQQVVLDRLPDAAASRRDDDDDELETFGSQRTIGFVDIGSLLAAFLEAVKQEFGDSLSSVPNLGQELQRAWDERVGSVSVRTPISLRLSCSRIYSTRLCASRLFPTDWSARIWAPRGNP